MNKSGLITNCGKKLDIGDEVIIDGLLRGKVTREDTEPDPMYLPTASCTFYIEDKDGKEHAVEPFFIVHKIDCCVRKEITDEIH